MDTNTDYLLQLTTDDIKRSSIKIDNVAYELAEPEDFELDDFLKLSDAGQKASELMRKRVKSDADIETIKVLLNTVVKAVIRNLPDEVYTKLKLTQKMAVMKVFSEVVDAKLGDAPRPQVGQRLSPVSKDSTEATSTPGLEPKSE